MDIGKLSSSIAETSNNTEVGYAVLKKAQDADKAIATELIDSVKSTSSVQSLPAHLGNTINTTA